jgi:hypothetical protein
MKILFSAFIFYLSCYAFTCGNTNYFNVRRASGEELKFLGGNLEIIGQGTSLGKIITKYVYFFNSREEYEKISEQFNKLKYDLRCNLGEASVVCIVFGNEYVKMISRDVDFAKGIAKYSFEIKETESSNLLLDIQISNDVEKIDEKFMNIFKTHLLSFFG